MISLRSPLSIRPVSRGAGGFFGAFATTALAEFAGFADAYSAGSAGSAGSPVRWNPAGGEPARSWSTAGVGSDCGFWQRRALEAERRAERSAAVVRAGLFPHLARALQDRLLRRVHFTHVPVALAGDGERVWVLLRSGEGAAMAVLGARFPPVMIGKVIATHAANAVASGIGTSVTTAVDESRAAKKDNAREAMQKFASATGNAQAGVFAKARQAIGPNLLALSTGSP